ncbi:MAG: hypothetical protein ACTSYU_12585 [Promethearchaeota archaeon]
MWILYHIGARNLFTVITANKIECPITPEIDEYTQNITDSIIQRLSEGKIEP